MVNHTAITYAISPQYDTYAFVIRSINSCDAREQLKCAYRLIRAFKMLYPTESVYLQFMKRNWLDMKRYLDIDLAKYSPIVKR